MKPWKAFLLAWLLVLVIVVVGAALLIHHGFRATNQPSALEKVAARAARDYSIPGAARSEKNPLDVTPQNLQDGRDAFIARCQNCHGHDASGLTPIGQSLYPRVPDLRGVPTQDLTDGEIHYIIENGVELTGMPAWGNPHQVQNDDSWKLVLYIRSPQHDSISHSVTREFLSRLGDAPAALAFPDVILAQFFLVFFQLLFKLSECCLRAGARVGR